MKLLLVIVFIFRLALSTFPSFEIDQTAFRFWSERLTQLGPAHFYSQEVFTDNPLGFLYVFWAMGEFKKYFLPNLSYYSSGFDFLLKLPNNLADILTGFLLYLILKRHKGEGWGRAGFLLYALNPAVIFGSSIFGQFDGSVALFMVLSVYLILIKKKPALGVLPYAIAWVIKPQAIFLAPALGLLILSLTKPRKWFLMGLIFLLGILLLYWPFFPANPLAGLVYVNQHSLRLFSCTTCFSFNFWGIWGNWQNDLSLFLGLPLVGWGIILVLLSFLPVFFFKPFWIKFKEPYFYLTVAVSMMSFFILLTRMHERYVFYLLPFLLIASILIKSKFLLPFYIFFSLLITLNLYLPYTYYNQQMRLISELAVWLSDNFNKLSFVGFSSFIILLVYQVRFFRRLDGKN